MANTGAIVRVPEEARDSLKTVARAMGVTMQDLLVDLIAEAENKLFYRQMALGYAEIKQDPDLLKAESEFRDKLDRDMRDGLEDHENARKTTSRRTVAC